MNSEADHLCRSKILYHNDIVKTKREKINYAISKFNDNETKNTAIAKKIFEDNIKCQNKMLEIIGLLIETTVNEATFS